MSRFEITIILSLILAIVTVVFAYRKKGKKQDSLFGNCDSFVDKVDRLMLHVALLHVRFLIAKINPK